jgi:Ca2+-binding RTX toxin-like protein
MIGSVNLFTILFVHQTAWKGTASAGDAVSQATGRSPGEKTNMARRLALLAVSAAVMIVMVAGVALALSLTGTSGNDSLTGTQGRDEISGLQGDDTLVGMGGVDLILGGDNSDRLFGSSGNDSLFGGTGDDVFRGGLGNDRINAVGAEDNNQVDRVDCGAGTDTAFVNARDIVFGNCEQVTTFPDSSGGGGSGGGGGNSGPGLQ